MREIYFQALFWAVHHNQPVIVEMLINYGARLNEVDRSSRNLLEIANVHELQEIVDILKNHLNKDDKEDNDKNRYISNQVTSWHDFYPGLNKGQR